MANYQSTDTGQFIQAVLDCFGGTSSPQYLQIGTLNSTTTSNLKTYSLAVGNELTVTGWNTVATGNGNTAEGDDSHAEGYWTEARGSQSHTEGMHTYASGQCSHAEGTSSYATGESSHAEGSSSYATGESSHAEGSNTLASGFASHAEGYSTEASGIYSHTMGTGTKATRGNQLVIGAYNTPGYDVPFIIGDGSSNASRSNALLIDWKGNMQINAIDGQSWVDGCTNYLTSATHFDNNPGGERAAITIMNQPSSGHFYPWIRQRDNAHGVAMGIIASTHSWYVSACALSDTTTNRADAQLQFKYDTSELMVNNNHTAYPLHLTTDTAHSECTIRYTQGNGYQWVAGVGAGGLGNTFTLWSVTSGSCYYVNNAGRSVTGHVGEEAQVKVYSGAGDLYLYSQANSGNNRGIYTSSPQSKSVLSVNSAGTVTVNTSDRRQKIDKGQLNPQEAYNILNEVPIINFVYKEDEEYNNLEQSGVYAQDLRDVLLKYNYKNRNYLQMQQYEKEDEESENITPEYSYDISIPEENVRLYEMNYQALIPVLLKGWQIHETKIQELEARIQQLENK